MRVLYIDDDRVNTLLFVETCRLAQHIEIETAATGDEALDMVRQWRPDLLVVDLHLPDTTGFDLLPRLRAAVGADGLPAILCTADEAAVVERPAQEAGFSACWTKPVDLHKVLDALARLSAEVTPAAETPPAP
jgi:two-component system OmpR family response regulator